MSTFLFSLWRPAKPSTRGLVKPDRHGRGIVSEHLGRSYTGVDLSDEQIIANYEVADEWELDPGPSWKLGDGTHQHVPPGSADLILSCPPYHNREKYSDHPADLSAMRWDAFVAAHQQMVTQSAAALRPDRFFAWVISDVRDHKGHLRGLPAIAAQHIRDAGLHITNEIILAAPAGTRAKTMRIPWTAARTTSRRHQHIITAVKGDRKQATRRITNAD